MKIEQNTASQVFNPIKIISKLVTFFSAWTVYVFHIKRKQFRFISHFGPIRLHTYLTQYCLVIRSLREVSAKNKSLLTHIIFAQLKMLQVAQGELLQETRLCVLINSARKIKHSTNYLKKSVLSFIDSCRQIGTKRTVNTLCLSKQ